MAPPSCTVINATIAQRLNNADWTIAASATPEMISDAWLSSTTYFLSRAAIDGRTPASPHARIKRLIVRA